MSRNTIKEDDVRLTPKTISIIVTTYSKDTLYTQSCLEAIRRWKNAHHELIVVTHDESALLHAYLQACRSDGLIDRLLFAEPKHGHTRSFNLAAQYATGDVVFNICNDVMIGPSLVDDCAHKLRTDSQLGMIGWHWYSEGTFWENGKVVKYALRDRNNPNMSPQDERNIRQAPWFTGKFFEAVGGPKWLQLCNTSFFGMRRELLDKIGGGFSREYTHYWADDFLCYAVLDQGLDIRDFEKKFRSREYFHEIQYDHTDVEDRRRLSDSVQYDGAFLDSIRLLEGGMSREESIFLHLLGKSVPEGSVVTNVGVWRGSSAIVLLDTLKSKRMTFNVIDCFDLPEISAMSAQPPVTQEEFLKYIEPYISNKHNVNIIRANTLEMARFPKSDFVFLDAGHTKECIANDSRLVRECLTGSGVAAFHDYGCSSWPDIKPELDSVFEHLDSFQTVAVYRADQIQRLQFEWPDVQQNPADERTVLKAA